MSDKPPVVPILSDTCRWCLSCPYGSCLNFGHWQMRLREHQEELKRWEEQRALRPAEKTKPEPESGVTVEVPRAPRPARSVALPPGVRQYLASIARRGGCARSAKKTAASRANGKIRHARNGNGTVGP
jgi:hypothetical protein